MGYNTRDTNVDDFFAEERIDARRISYFPEAVEASGASEANLLLKPFFHQTTNNVTVAENGYHVFAYSSSSFVDLLLPVDGSVDLVIVDHLNTSRNGQIFVKEGGSSTSTQTIRKGSQCIARFDGSAWSYNVIESRFTESHTKLPKYLSGHKQVDHIVPYIPSGLDDVVFHLEFDYPNSNENIEFRTTCYSPKLIVPPEGGVDVDVNIYVQDLDGVDWAHKITIPSPKYPFWLIGDVPNKTDITATLYCPNTGKFVKLEGDGSERQEFTATGLFDQAATSSGSDLRPVSIGDSSGDITPVMGSAEVFVTKKHSGVMTLLLDRLPENNPSGVYYKIHALHPDMGSILIEDRNNNSVITTLDRGCIAYFEWVENLSLWNTTVVDNYYQADALGSVVWAFSNKNIDSSADFAVDCTDRVVNLSVRSNFTGKFRVYDYKGSFETNTCTVDFSNFSQGTVTMQNNFDDIEFFYIPTDGWYLWDRKINFRTRV